MLADDEIAQRRRNGIDTDHDVGGGESGRERLAALPAGQKLTGPLCPCLDRRGPEDQSRRMRSHVGDRSTLLGRGANAMSQRVARGTVALVGEMSRGLFDRPNGFVRRHGFAEIFVAWQSQRFARRQGRARPNQVQRPA